MRSDIRWMSGGVVFMRSVNWNMYLGHVNMHQLMIPILVLVLCVGRNRKNITKKNVKVRFFQCSKTGDDFCFLFCI